MKATPKKLALSVKVAAEKIEEAELDVEGNARFSGYENQSFALAEIAEHQRKYIKVEKSS